ncbi:DUF485 domain-containing protein [uncultured Desulfuromonas sp.]|uniref:DUF485 domain-containing protein n=1 Tax=uncultured Desulfuromonas sp. TaxID=181013 RepID=UPI002AAB7F0F|nr:DUF485 domain-containing protein [uncultured Desulfuromonas sp.]
MADKTMTLKQRYAEPLSRERARIGRRIFFVYLALYGLFVLAHVAWPQLTRYPVGGVGLGLIACVVLMVATCVAALLFHLWCERLERRARQGGQP